VAGCELEWVDSYPLAREMIAQNQYDIYLVDYRLSGYNGLELLREAINNGCTCPFILLTGQSDREIDIEAMEGGAVDYLEKSQLTGPLLERSIRYTIERKQTERKIRQQAALLDFAIDAILVGNLEEQILFWNKAAEHLYGWSQEEAQTKKYGISLQKEAFFNCQKDSKFSLKISPAKENYIKLPKMVKRSLLKVVGH
jgi:DNA-binding response OmpR family regulator